MLQELCKLLPRVDKAERSELLCQIHNEAGRLPYLDDKDQGAILLEQIGDQSQDRNLRLLCYTHALYRARWCAQAASGAGEGISRGNHVKILDEKRRSAEQKD